MPVLYQPDRLTVKSGQGFDLDASSTDPDGDNLSFLWFNYPAAGFYKKKVETSAENVHGIYVTAPDVTQKETLHFIVTVTNKSTPALTRYKRVTVTVMPK